MTREAFDWKFLVETLGTLRKGEFTSTPGWPCVARSATPMCTGRQVARHEGGEKCMGAVQGRRRHGSACSWTVEPSDLPQRHETVSVKQMSNVPLEEPLDGLGVALPQSQDPAEPRGQVCEAVYPPEPLLASDAHPPNHASVRRRTGELRTHWSISPCTAHSLLDCMRHRGLGHAFAWIP